MKQVVKWQSVAKRLVSGNRESLPGFLDQFVDFLNTEHEPVFE